MASNNTFQFGSSQSSFDFNMPGKIEPLPSPAPPEHVQQVDPNAEQHKGQDYVSFAQYEFLEKRLVTLEHESKMSKLAQETIKNTAKKIQDAYHALQAIHQSANNRIRELELTNQDINKRLEISKAAFENVRAQNMATDRELLACQKRLELAEAANSQLRSSNEAVLHDYKVKIEKELTDEYYANMMAWMPGPSFLPSTLPTAEMSPEAATPAPAPLGLAPIITIAETLPVVETTKMTPVKEKQPTLSLMPTVTVAETSPVAATPAPLSLSPITTVVETTPVKKRKKGPHLDLVPSITVAETTPVVEISTPLPLVTTSTATQTSPVMEISTPLPPVTISTATQTTPVMGNPPVQFPPRQPTPITTIVESIPAPDDAAQYRQLEQTCAAILRGQNMVKRHFFILWLLISMGVAAWLVSPHSNSEGPGALGYGWLEEDGYLARAHAIIFMFLLEMTGGLTVYM